MWHESHEHVLKKKTVRWDASSWANVQELALFPTVLWFLTFHCKWHAARYKPDPRYFMTVQLLRDIFMNLNSGSPAKFQPSRERHGETWETTFSEFSVLFDLALCSPKWLRWDKAVLEMAPTWFCGACPNHWLIDLVQRSTERQCARQPSLVSSLSSHAGPVTSIPTSSPSKEICGAGRLQVVPSI